MNLYLRLVWILLSSLWKPRMAVTELTSSLTQRVWPSDLDLNLHMNNGRFLTVCDLNRVDLFVRSGLLAIMLTRKWSPIVASHTMTYRKAIRPFQKYVVTMTIERWDEKCFYATHRFVSMSGTVLAEGTSVAVIRARSGVISPALVVEAVAARQGRTVAAIPSAV